MVKEKPPFYERRWPFIFCKIAGAAAGVMLLASPFFGWRAVDVKADVRVHESFSLFDLMKRVLKTGEGWTANQIMGHAVLLLLIFLTGLAFLYIAYRDQFRPGTSKESSFFFDRLISRFRFTSRLILPVFPIVSAVLFERTVVYGVLYEKLYTIYRSWDSLINIYYQVNATKDGQHCWFWPGLGCWFLYAGILLFLVAEGFRYVLDVLNEEDDEK